MDKRSTGPGHLPSDRMIEHVLPKGVPNLIGTEVGNYKITRYIGQGGMGAVFVAVNTIGKEVAIKILRADLPQQEQRILREAKAAGVVRQDGIVDIIDIGRLPSGQHYIMMEYIEGITLKEEIERQATGLIAQHKALHYAHCIAKIMVGVHERNYIHRDLKPANIMIVQKTYASDEPLPNVIKVFDFGLARAINQFEASVSFSVTTLEGTALYMAPEQWDDNSDGRPKLSFKIDVYALGCIMYEMLTGMRPFDGTNLQEIEIRHRTETPRSLRAFEATIGSDLESLVLRMLAKAPDNRPNMEYVRDYLKNLLQSLAQPTPAARVSLSPGNPFIGLRAYTQQESSICSLYSTYLPSILEGFGRSGRHWLHIDGPRHCGKTSFIQAGVCAAIGRRQGKFASANIVFYRRLGENALLDFASLLLASIPELGSTAQELTERFDRNQDGLLKVLEEFHRKNKQQSVVLVIDPLEDFLAVDFAERHKIECLLACAVKASYSPFFLITSIRSENSWRWEELSTLSFLLPTAYCLQLPTLDAEVIVEKLQAQAERQGYALEPELKDALKSDMNSIPPPLPIINFVMGSIWYQRNEHCLTRSAYEALRPLHKILEQTAESVLNSVPESLRASARLLLTALVKPGRGGEDTLRSLSWEEVERLMGSSEQAIRVVAPLSARASMEASSGGANFAIISVQQSALGKRAVILAHELLMRRWTRLREWIEEAREVLERWDALETATAKAQVDRLAPVIAKELAGYFSGSDLKESQREHLERLQSPAAKALLAAALEHVRLSEAKELERQASLQRELEREQNSHRDTQKVLASTKREARRTQATWEAKVAALTEQLESAQKSAKQALKAKEKVEAQLAEVETASNRRKRPARRFAVSLTITFSVLVVVWFFIDKWPAIAPGANRIITELRTERNQKNDTSRHQTSNNNAAPTITPSPAPAPHKIETPPGPLPVVPPKTSVTPGMRRSLSGKAAALVGSVVRDGISAAPALWMDITEVTVAEFKKCVDAGACRYDAAALPAKIHPKCNIDRRFGNGTLDPTDTKNHPMNCVTAEEAEAYCGFVQKRLPTMPEWLSAARSAANAPYTWGPALPTDQPCWRELNGTCPVGSHPKDVSPFNILDLVGNVAEWTASKTPSRLAESGMPLRVFAGGNWFNSQPEKLVLDAEHLLDPATRQTTLGFRCVREYRPGDEDKLPK